MSYENAVPKPLKFLISDGKMIDDSGNVIAESETLKDLYTKWNPEIKKYLLSDGSVIDEEGNLIVKNDYYKKIYDQADPKVAKYLHSDGTVDENPGGGSGACSIYAWYDSEHDEVIYTSFDKIPAKLNDFYYLFQGKIKFDNNWSDNLGNLRHKKWTNPPLVYEWYEYERKPEWDADLW